MAVVPKISFSLIFRLFLLVTAVTLFGCLIRTIQIAENIEVNVKVPSDFKSWIPADEKRVTNFQNAIKVQTISFSSGNQNFEELAKFKKFLIEAYPTIHNSPLVHREVINNYSLLYKVQGSDDQLKPYMLCAHIDVVPVVAKLWDEPTFDGKKKDGFIYGRGTLDTKETLVGIMEALEYNLQEGYRFRRTLYIAFGHDEEVKGYHGALNIAKYLEARNIKFEFILDEGTGVLKDVIKSIKEPVAAISVTEKGYCMVDLTVEHRGGHAATPVKDGPISISAKAIARLEDNPHPSQLGNGPEYGFFRALAPKMDFVSRFCIANMWLFRPLLSWTMSQNPVMNAFIRTTTAVTIFNAGFKDNVLPQLAKVTINHRIHPSETVEQVLAYDRKIINDDRVKITIRDDVNPPHVSPHDETSFGYNLIKHTVKSLYKDAFVVPGVLIGNTDTLHYVNLSQSIYRFEPVLMLPDDIPRFHGNNERMSIENFERAINFYYRIMQSADKMILGPPHQHGEL